jgi:hypothetical protein
VKGPALTRGGTIYDTRVKVASHSCTCNSGKWVKRTGTNEKLEHSGTNWEMGQRDKSGGGSVSCLFCRHHAGHVFTSSFYVHNILLNDFLWRSVGAERKQSRAIASVGFAGWICLGVRRTDWRRLTEGEYQARAPKRHSLNLPIFSSGWTERADCELF